MLQTHMVTHGKNITDPLLDPLQFNYRASRSLDSGVNMASTTSFNTWTLQEPTPGSCLWISAPPLTPIILVLLKDKPSQLHMPDSICRWITDFLSDRRQHLKLGKHIFDSRTISTGSPQGCVLSSLLFSLYTNSCSHQSIKLLKFVDEAHLAKQLGA